MDTMRSPSPDPYSDIGTDSTQPQTQPQTESVAQDLTETLEIDPDCWGLLVPCSAGQPSGIIQLKKKPDNDAKQASWPRSAVEEHSFKIGRGSSNDVILPGQKISHQHCTLTWSGRSGDKPGKDNAVVVHDNSSNGTFVSLVNLPTPPLLHYETSCPPPFPILPQHLFNLLPIWQVDRSTVYFFFQPLSINGKRIGKTKKSLLTPGDELSFGLPGQDLDDLDYRAYWFRIVPCPRIRSAVGAMRRSGQR
ncbi:kinase-like protein [Rhizoctonia solani]|uniref:Kinase-like protein n=1 Tax=Rhizoctonia solani TaxID=456999 RepID=A0A8H7LKD4_9AGAM|nr:kinase-like protein [Rhizoctonia solani]